MYEFFKPLEVGVPARGKLIEERAEVLAQASGRVDKPFNSISGLVELFHVCDVPAGFDGKKEAWMRSSLLSPGAELVLGRQAVEAAVDLHGWKVLCVVGKMFLNGEVWRVETPDPVGVNPARGADPDHLQERLARLVLIKAMKRNKAAKKAQAGMYLMVRPSSLIT